MAIKKIPLTGKILNKEWGVNANQALYRRTGNWYHHLKDFPGALFDENGYILFQTEQDYLNCDFLQLSKEIHVPKGISSIPGYKRVFDLNSQAQDLTNEELTMRVSYKVNRVVRDTPLAHDIKNIYDFSCQICSEVLLLFGGKPYAEAHHIKPLGSRHNGPDIKENIICVCPNCHALLDFGAIPLDKNILKLDPSHNLSDNFVEYHNSFIYLGAKVQVDR